MPSSSSGDRRRNGSSVTGGNGGGDMTVRGHWQGSAGKSMVTGVVAVAVVALWACFYARYQPELTLQKSMPFLLVHWGLRWRVRHYLRWPDQHEARVQPLSSASQSTGQVKARLFLFTQLTSLKMGYTVIFGAGCVAGYGETSPSNCNGVNDQRKTARRANIEGLFPPIDQPLDELGDLKDRDVLQAMSLLLTSF